MLRLLPWQRVIVRAPLERTCLWSCHQSMIPNLNQVQLIILAHHERRSFTREPAFCRPVSFHGSLLIPFLVEVGDGIMAMIDCKVAVAKKEKPKGDRAV